MLEFPVYVGGEFIKTNSSTVVINPYSQQPIAKVYLASEVEIDKAIKKAIAAKEVLKDLSSAEREKILLTIAFELEKFKEDFTKTIIIESGKPYKYALAEVERAIQTFKVASEETKRWPAELLKLDWTVSGKNKEGIVNYFPIGLIAGISPFNFPLNLAVHKIAPAIAAGCPILLKPATKTPLSTLKLAEIIHQSGLPIGAFSVLPCSRTNGLMLVEDPRIKLVSFTGSPEVGWNLKLKAGKKKVILELGGNAGLIITSTANIETSVNKAVVGGFSYSGQVCIHTQRILVHEDIFNQWVDLFISKVRQLKIGDPMQKDTDIACMIDADNVLRVSAWINESLANGAKVLCGGSYNGLIFEPTVLTNSSVFDKVNCEEVFGPVVTIEKYKDFKDAVSVLNNSRFGLQAGVFTNLHHEINYAYNYLEVGGVIINDTPTFRVDHMPYGGIKDSGLGREGVKYAMLEMLEPKILVKDFR
jgi:glyceraldehyde-3-phosphate dehydrogenase (NADP+)